MSTLNSQSTQISRRMPSVIGTSIQSARNAKGLTQQNFGQLIGEKLSVVKEYESGRIVPNSATVKKMERVLRTKLL
jgi:putative transcription factor